MSEIDNCDKQTNENYNCVKFVKFPISEGMFPVIQFENKPLKNERKNE